MNRFQMETIYEANGLDDYKLNTSEDLLKCHGISIPCVSGYSDLTEENKVIFNKFILGYLNGIGLDYRMIFSPVSVNYVEDIDYTAPDPDYKDDLENNTVVSVKRVINIIKKDGTKEQFHKYQEKEYKNLEYTKKFVNHYLRFEFKEGKRKVWLHVLDGGSQWY